MIGPDMPISRPVSAIRALLGGVLWTVGDGWRRWNSGTSQNFVLRLEGSNFGQPAGLLGLPADWAARKFTPLHVAAFDLIATTRAAFRPGLF
jgi:hypothetical protein